MEIMIKCPECKHKFQFEGDHCPVCSAEIQVDLDAVIREHKRRLRKMERREAFLKPIDRMIKALLGNS